MTEQTTGRDTHIGKQTEKERRKAGAKKEELYKSLESFRTTLSIGDDPRFKKLEALWSIDRSVHQKTMLTSHDTNEVFSSRGLFGAFTIVLDWRNSFQVLIKATNIQIN